MQDSVINPWCKLYIAFLIFFQLYLYEWQLPSNVPPFIIPTILGGLMVVFTKRPGLLSKVGRFLSIGSICIQIPLLFAFLCLALLFQNPFSFELLLAMGTIFYFVLGVVLYSCAFWIQPSTYKAAKETSVFFIILTMIFLGSIYFKGGPHISKAKITSDTPPYIKNQIKKLYSWNPLQRSDAAGRLGNFSSLSVPAVPFLISMLDDDVSYSEVGDSNSQLTPGEIASRTLNKIGKPAAMLLITAIKSKNPYIRKNAISALNSNMGTEAQNVLLSCLEDENQSVRKKAIYKMELVYKKTRDPRIIPALTSALSDKHSAVRIAAARTLIGIKDPRIIEPLISSLGDKDRNKDFLKSVTYALERSTNQKFGVNQKAWRKWWQSNKEAFIEKSFLKEREYFLEVISYSLRNLADPFDISLLADALRDQNINVRKSAAWMLGESGSPQAVGPLVRALGNNKLSVQKVLSRKLFQITAVNIGPDAEKWERWWRYNKEEFLFDRNKYIRDYPGYLLDALYYAQDDAFRVARKLGDPAILPLIATLKNGTAKSKGKAASTLGWMKDLRAVEPLINTLCKESGSLRNSASHSLTQLTGQDFGEDPEKWRKWWNKNRSDFF